MEPITILRVSPENGPIIGIALIAYDALTEHQPALIGNGAESMEVPMEFYRGDINIISTKLHQRVDQLIDALTEQE